MNRSKLQAVRHVGFEDLGSFEPIFRDAGYDIDYVDVASRDLSVVAPLRADLLAVLGDPIGVNDEETYPMVNDELDLLKVRLGAAGQPWASALARNLRRPHWARGYIQARINRLAGLLSTCLSARITAPSVRWMAFLSCTGAETPSFNPMAASVWPRRRSAATRPSPAV